MRALCVTERDLHAALIAAVIEHLASVLRNVDEEAFHRGEAAVLQLIAHKRGDTG